MTTDDPGSDEDAFLDIEGIGILSRAAFMLHTAGIVNSFRDGHPGFVSDDYLNAISAETTIAAAELEAAGIWERRPSGYFIVADDMVKMLVNHNERTERLAAECEAEGAHLPGEKDAGWVICTRCGAPLDRPDGGPVAPPDGGRPPRRTQP